MLPVTVMRGWQRAQRDGAPADTLAKDGDGAGGADRAACTLLGTVGWYFQGVAIAHNCGYLKSSLREALVERVFCVVDMSQCSIWVSDRDSQYPTGISDAPFLLLVLGMKHLSCVGARTAADQGCG